MNLGSLYLLAFFGAKPFDSADLDSLAQRMGVLKLMSPNTRERYFITSANGFTAAALGNKVVFGRPYYERLSDEERLAVSAHEFGHILDRDNCRRKIASKTLLVSLALTVATFLAFHSVLLTESVFCLAFLGLMRILSSRDVERSRLQELKCDSAAASMVGVEPTITSIRLADSMLARRSGLRLFSRSSTDPSVEERTDAIMALRAGN